MPADPLVSIIVPTFNRAQLVREAVESALAQTWRNVEILVVDDGSTDNTPHVLDELQRRDERVRPFSQENRGVSAARNRGLAAARGDFIAFLDSDDAWYPWKLEVQMRLLARRPELVMCWTDMDAVGPGAPQPPARYLRQMYTAYRRFPNGQPFHHAEPLLQVLGDLPDGLRDTLCSSGPLYSQMLTGNLVHTSTVVLRREVAERLGGFDETMRRGGEDFKYHLATCRLGPVALIDAPSIRYRVGEEDRITHPRNSVHFARSFLRTLSEELRGHRAEVLLSRRELASVLSEAHQWLAEAEWADAGRCRAARHALCAMWYAGTPSSAWKPLLKSFLPHRVLGWLRRLRSRFQAVAREPNESRGTSGPLASTVHGT